MKPCDWNSMRPAPPPRQMCVCYGRNFAADQCRAGEFRRTAVPSTPMRPGPTGRPSLQTSESRRHVGLEHRGEPPPRMLQIEEVLARARERAVGREIEKGRARPLFGPGAEARLAVR